jgi:hypothetical protein
MGGNIRVTRESFERRRDKTFFQWLAPRLPQDITCAFFVSQYVEADGAWIGNIVFEKELANKRYLDWEQRMGRLWERYAEDINTIAVRCKSWELAFATPSGQHPAIFKMVSQRQIAPETYSILHHFTNFITICEERLGDQMFEELNLRYRKYTSFLPISKEKFLELTPKVLTTS